MSGFSSASSTASVASYSGTAGACASSAGTACGWTGRCQRKALRAAFDWQGRLHFTPHRNRDGEKWLRAVCRKGWEGLIAKRADSRYVRTRSRDWLKFTCSAGQELVIGGFTEPRGTRKGFGALLLGYYENGRFRYDVLRERPPD